MHASGGNAETSVQYARGKGQAASFTLAGLGTSMRNPSTGRRPWRSGMGVNVAPWTTMGVALCTMAWVMRCGIRVCDG